MKHKITPQSFSIGFTKIKPLKHLFLGLLLCISTTMFAQIGVRSPSVQSEVTFQWEEIQGINFDGDTDAVESTNGAFPLKVTIKYFSGGELNNTNNDDVDYIEYNNN